MKLIYAIPIALSAALITAAPTASGATSLSQRDTSTNPIFDLTQLHSLGLTDVADDWTKIKSVANCPPVATIFARGTFDSGNVGVFVGPELFSFLTKKIPGVSNQGVDSTKYPATLMDYLKLGGGSTVGADSMADQVIAIHKICGDKTVFVFTGWSQGAIVCRKALEIIVDKHPDVLKQIAGMGTFGDPHSAWEAANGKKFSFPSHWKENIDYKSLCVTGLPHVDFLCAPFSIEGYKPPTSPSDFLGPWGTPATVGGLFKGAVQIANAPIVLKHLIKELTPIVGSGAVWPLLKVVISTHPTRAMLRPAHFTYGNSEFAEKMAEFIAGLKMVKESVAKHEKPGGAAPAGKAAGAKAAVGGKKPKV